MTELETALEQVTAHLAETMFFTTVVDREGDLGGEPGYSASISFSGSHAGTVRVAMSHSTAEALAANFLGETDEDGPAARAAALVGELANILCGSLAGRMDPAGRFTIGTPEVAAGTGAPDEAPDEAPDARRVFTLEEGPVEIGVIWRDQ